MDYQPPLEDWAFLLDHLVDLGALARLPAFAKQDLSTETARAVFAEAGRVAAEVLAPLNGVGDRLGARLEGDRVVLPEGFAAAWRALAEGGWTGISLPVEAGGLGLPELFNTVVAEFWNGANMAFALNPMLSLGAAGAILAHGTAAQIEAWVPAIARGEMSGTMNLTEPEAGSDLGPIRTRAEPAGDHFRIRGQKIFITWGEHELARNIVHLVLARLPDAPPGSRGLSLFLVPKFLPDGRRNDLRCLALECKLGLHASPTCQMSYGERDGAVGWLLGEANRGLACMFTMMNEARLKVGIQGLGVAERARQASIAYARSRQQGGVAIARHPDVVRMLLTQRALVEAMRAVAGVEAVVLDRARHGEDPDLQARVDLLIPVIKGWFTELAQEVASLAIQIHGGAGYVEETGVAQLWRDVRVAAIYEGTNGIQAADLVRRKLGRDDGVAMARLLAEIAGDCQRPPQGAAACAAALAATATVQGALTRALVEALGRDPEDALLGSFDYLMATGYLLGGWQMLRAWRAAQGEAPFAQAKRATARFYLEHLLPRARAHQEAAGRWQGRVDWTRLACGD
ncbi:MAG: acyl-CoA dehydrogenase [Porticoccaceae bacterium]|nr:MAG: acyl-CoA dehydrogenase [Porticoccaceae bacterium]